MRHHTNIQGWMTPPSANACWILARGSASYVRPRVFRKRLLRVRAALIEPTSEALSVENATSA